MPHALHSRRKLPRPQAQLEPTFPCAQFNNILTMCELAGMSSVAVLWFCCHSLRRGGGAVATFSVKHTPTPCRRHPGLSCGNKRLQLQHCDNHSNPCHGQQPPITGCETKAAKCSGYFLPLVPSLCVRLPMSRHTVSPATIVRLQSRTNNNSLETVETFV